MTAADALTPEMIAQMANVATVLYSTPFKVAARVFEDPRLDLADEELSAIHAANQLGVSVVVPKLGDNAPIYFWGACLAAPLVMRADLVVAAVKKAKRFKTQQIPAAPARPEDNKEKTE